MSLIPSEELPEEIFNYTDPNWADRLAKREASPALCVSTEIEYRDLIHNPSDVTIYYEGLSHLPVRWVFEAKKHRLFQSDWSSVVDILATKNDDALVGSSIELAQVLAEINDLAFKDEEDQFGASRPTYHSFKHCLHLVLSLASGGRLLKPSDITADHNGDIRISWARAGREAELVCPAEGQPYVYYSDEQEFGTVEEITAEQLVERVRWALEGK